MIGWLYVWVCFPRCRINLEPFRRLPIWKHSYFTAFLSRPALKLFAQCCRYTSTGTWQPCTEVKFESRCKPQTKVCMTLCSLFALRQALQRSAAVCWPAGSGVQVLHGEPRKGPVLLQHRLRLHAVREQRQKGTTDRIQCLVVFFLPPSLSVVGSVLTLPLTFVHRTKWAPEANLDYLMTRDSFTVARKQKNWRKHTVELLQTQDNKAFTFRLRRPVLYEKSV